MAKKLPKKLSALMLLALKDLEQVENDSRYNVDMGTWHKVGAMTNEDGEEIPFKVGDTVKCNVCFAGSVMAKSLKADPNSARTLESFGHENESKFRALDHARSGEILDALENLGAAEGIERFTKAFGVVVGRDDWDEEEIRISPLPVTEHNDDPVQFKNDMITIIGWLQANGL